MKTIKLILTGDFCPQFRIEKFALEKKPDLIFNELIHDLKGSDLNIIDLECPLITDGRPIRKTGPNLKASPLNIEVLKYGNVHLAAMANNHIRDYGDAGLMETIELCKNNGIATVGVGKNIEEARRPFGITIRGKKISVLNFTDHEWSNTYGPEPGANPVNLINNQKDIRNASKESDYVIVLFHGGNEFYELPSPRVKEILRYYADSGATAVIAHHTHVSSGYEIYNNVPIFYGTGNFCYDEVVSPTKQWNYGYAVMLKLSDGTDFELIPFVQNENEPGIHKLVGTAREEFIKRIEGLSDIIKDDELLQERFAEYCRQNAYRYDLLFEPYRNRLLAYLKKRRLIPSLMTKRKKRLFLNIIRCDAHRDMLLEYLKKYER